MVGKIRRGAGVSFLGRNRLPFDELVIRSLEQCFPRDCERMSANVTRAEDNLPNEPPFLGFSCLRKSNPNVHLLPATLNACGSSSNAELANLVCLGLGGQDLPE